MNYFEPILRLFQAQTLQRKITLFGGVVFIIVLTIGLIIWAMAPTYGVLFSHLDNRSANQILTQLEQANIAYQVRNQGADILIDKQLVSKTRIKLMGSDLQFTHSVGFELFDKTDFGMTDFSQKINYQRALQGELERTINSLDEISSARVQLTIPESHLFQQENNLPRVAVTLHLNQPLTPQQVKSIQQLITASVANMPLKNVVIVDQNGNGLIAQNEESASGHFAAKKNVESYLNEKVMLMLRPIFRADDIMVKIDATLNFDELQRERVKPQHNGSITHEKETRHSTVNKTNKAPANQDFTREKSYEFGREKEQFTRAGGTIQRLTISVVLPQNTTRKKITQVERLVKSVVGFDIHRGDTISVEALIEKSNRPSSIDPLPLVQHDTSYNYSQLYNVVAGVFVLLIMTLYVRKRMREKLRTRLLAELRQWLIEHD